MDEEQVKAYERKFSKLSASEILDRLVRYEEQLQELQAKRQIASRVYAQVVSGQTVASVHGVTPAPQPPSQAASKPAEKKAEPAKKKLSPAPKPVDAPVRVAKRSGPNAKEETTPKKLKMAPVHEENVLMRTNQKRMAKVQAAGISRAIHEVETSESSSSSSSESNDDDDIVPFKKTPQKIGSSQSVAKRGISNDNELDPRVKQTMSMVSSDQLVSLLKANREAVLAIFEACPARSPRDSDFMVCEKMDSQKEWTIPAARRGEVIPKVRGRSGKSEQSFALSMLGTLLTTNFLEGTPSIVHRADPRDFNEINRRILMLLAPKVEAQAKPHGN